MTDFKFKFTPTQRGPLSDACRGAVLFPIAKRAKLGRGETRESLASRYEIMQRRWRIRVSVLGEKGWSQAQGLRIQYMRNCPPFGVTKFTDPSRPCKLARICPMCYARRVSAKMFRCAEFAFYMGRSTPMKGFEALAIKRTWEFGPDKSAAELFAAAKKSRRYEVDTLSHRGAVVLSLVEPIPTGWKITRSALMIVKSGVEVDEDRFKRLKTKHLAHITKGGLSKLVAWTSQYPTGMMFGDTDRTIEVLRAGKSAHMFTADGLMRNKTYRELLK